VTAENQQQEETSGAAAPSGTNDAPAGIDGLRARLAEEQEKAQTYLANWQRAAADYQNFKRRVETERSEVGRLANIALIINLLPLIDDLERALRTVDTKLAGLTWIDGVWLIYRKFQAILENAGVKEIEADGRPFDPRLHEAISEAPGDEGKVISVVQKGYLLGDRVVRPAMVIVGRGGGEPKEPEPGDGDTQADISG
jgi:molecular chaperone GrpE